MSDLERAFEQLGELGKRGWCLSFDLEGDRVSDLRGLAGDCNCPHRKNYDPADGHGFSSFGATDDHVLDKATRVITLGPVAGEWYGLMGDETTVAFPIAVDFFYRHAMKLEPGAPWAT